MKSPSLDALKDLEEKYGKSEGFLSKRPSRRFRGTKGIKGQSSRAKARGKVKG